MVQRKRYHLRSLKEEIYMNYPKIQKPYRSQVSYKIYLKLKIHILLIIFIFNFKKIKKKLGL